MTQNQYTAGEVRELLQLSRLLHETASVTERRHLLLTALCRMSGASSGHGLLLDERMQPVGAAVSVDLSEIDGQSRGRAENHDPVGGAPFFRMNNPMAQPFLAAFARHPTQPTTLSRRQLVSDTTWYQSQHFEQYRRARGLDDCLISAVSLPGIQPRVSAICLNHPDGSPLVFSSADCRAVELIHSELRWANAIRSLTAEERQNEPPPQPPIGVPPRYQRVLVRLLAGDSEKQIAVALALSRHTIHEYIRSLYRQLGVSSRSELMAQFVSPGAVPAPRSTSLPAQAVGCRPSWIVDR